MTLNMQPAPPIKLTNILGDAELEMWNTNAGVLPHSMATFIANKFSQLSDQQCRELTQHLDFWTTTFSVFGLKDMEELTLHDVVRDIVRTQILSKYAKKFAYRWVRFGKADYHLFMGTSRVSTWSAVYQQLMTSWEYDGFETAVSVAPDGRVYVELTPTEDDSEPDGIWGKYDEEAFLSEGTYVYYVGHVIEEKNDDKL
jgi:hypothetical protein